MIWDGRCAHSEGGGRAREVLAVRHLTLSLESSTGSLRPVDDVSFDLMAGETIGIAGESGAGKSMLVRGVMGLMPNNVKLEGTVELNGLEITKLPSRRRKEYLGAGIALVFQDPMTSLNPVATVGRQVTDGMRFHGEVSRKERRERAISLLEQVGLSEPAKRFKQYPHELSGGMRQRVTIAAALACNPRVLIADEATTALDVTVQKQILDLLGDIQRERRMGMILISHDLGILAGRTDRVLVMYAGQIVEMGPTRAVFKGHRHRYTAALLQAMPRLSDGRHSPLSTIAGAPPLLTAMPPGCRFASRCGWASEDCLGEEPALQGQRHVFRCVHPVSVEVETGVGGNVIDGGQ